MDKKEIVKEVDAIIVMVIGIAITSIGLHTNWLQYPSYYGAFGIFIFLIGLTYVLTRTLSRDFGEKFYLFVIIVWIYGLVLALSLLNALEILSINIP